MARATPSSVAILSMAGLAVLLCGGMVVMLEYAQVKYEEKSKPAAANEKPAQPAGPYAEKLSHLDRKAAAVVRGEEQDPLFFNSAVRSTDAGLYLDVLSDEVLFSSADKLVSEFGYAEFSKPLNPSEIEEIPAKPTDLPEDGTRIRTKKASTHLGWIRMDSSGKRRWLVNPSSVRFVSAADLEKNGLGAFRTQFP